MKKIKKLKLFLSLFIGGAIILSLGGCSLSRGKDIKRNINKTNNAPIEKVFKIDKKDEKKIEQLLQGQGKESKYLKRISDMTTERGAHSMALLADGRVLITGGLVYYKPSLGEIGASAKAEIYNPKTNTFTKVSDMASPHAYHSNVLLNDGKVLIIDGFRPCEIFNPKTNSFFKISPLQIQRNGLSLIFTNLMPDGNVLVIGGEKPEIELYNPKTKTFKVINKFQINRNYPAITKLNNKKVLLIGGCKLVEKNNKLPLECESIPNTEIYDYSTNTVKEAANMIIPRYGATTTLLDNGKLLITGGVNNNHVPIAKSEIYDPVKNKFKLGASMLIPRYKHQSIKLSNGKVLIVGGILNDSSKKYKSTIEIYNPKTNTFEYGTETNPEIYNDFKLILIKNNKVLITGGCKNGCIKASWLYSY